VKLQDGIRDIQPGQFVFPGRMPASAARRFTCATHCADAVIELSAMRVRIFSNEIEAPLSPFIGKFLGNVCIGITSSLKTPQPLKSLKYEIDGESVHIEVNHMPVPLNMSQGFSRIIVLDTIRGMIRHLKMEDPNGAIRIEVEMETVS
jgi:hypothetical protein